MFNHKLKGKVFIVFSDPGGAKPCLSIADKIDKFSLNVISDREYRFYADFSSKVILVKNEIEIEHSIDKFKPDIIFTGTSYTSEIEKKTIEIAKKKGILVLSFVDHWTSISDRFRTKNEELNLPDEIWVLDERAKQIAIKEGINENKLFISGNPYHNWLKEWKPSIEKEQFFKNIGLSGRKKHILFAPDPLSNIDGINKYGFDEYVASSRMVECVERSTVEFKNSHHFLIKMHPNQSKSEIVKIFKGHNNFTILPLNIDTNQSIYFSDLVIGFFSSLLIEADVMNKPVIRFLEKKLKVDPFFGLNFGTITNSENLLTNVLKYSL